ncbi:hypothetical protein BTUL_0203g00040 [Botrytis tulipae]|uniref:Heterokaryon incompatibility domain-containing protein n=1 Tax=Botrytis tulipae TaxID=87230 RepID=A0A4Z1ED44_9HELO|nr:hypothetical protein BTUL_0203g00040 [Botrytis tulipae]
MSNINYSDEFQYDDLSETDSIRLLILRPGTLGSPIQSDLIHTTLREYRCDIHGNYMALSYVWGDANDTTYIFVDGFRFAVTVNLAAALHDLRDEKRQLRLWADAVCINQTNNVERSQQVGLMKEVYSYAQTTVIYLGALVEQAKSLFELMNQLDPDRTKLLEIAEDAIKDIGLGVSRTSALKRSIRASWATASSLGLSLRGFVGQIYRPERAK